MKLKHSIYLMFFLCSVLPVLIWMQFSLSDTERRMEEVISSNIEALAGSQKMSIHNFCEGRKEAMETITQMAAVTDNLIKEPTAESRLHLQEFLKSQQRSKSYIASISVLDKNFHVIGSSERHTYQEISEFKFSKDKFHQGEFRMAEVYERETNEGVKRIVPAFIGIYYDEELVGYLIEEIECTYFDRLRLQTGFLKDGTLYLLDAKGAMVTAGTGEETESRQELVTTEEERADYQAAWDAVDHEKNPSGFISYEVRGQEYLTYYSDVEYTDWTIRITENMSTQWETKRSMYLLTTVQAMALIAMLVVLQMIVTKKLIAPINSIMGTLKEVRAKRDYSLRTQVKRHDEMGTIADGIDELLAFIEQEELAEKQSHREELEEALHKAEASSRAKSTFLFNASHDIRTPMNAIQGFARIIAENADNTGLVEENIAKIQKSSQTLNDLLNNVLELSKIESGKDDPELTVVNLRELTEKLYTMFTQEMEGAGISFEIQNKMVEENVWTDELKCTRILMNMLSNARKFTPEGGRIVFGVFQQTKVQEEKAEYSLYVKDTGIGMSREFQERAFEQFEMERSSTNSGVIGSGLGLSIIKKMANQMGGDCVLESETGKGTKISVVVNLRTAWEESKAKKEAPAEEDSLAGKRVLLVEDNEFNREIAMYVLEGAGMYVEEAENGLESIHKLLNAKEESFDFVLMDIQMPVMDGYTATREIRQMKDPKLASIPIIAMTANAFKEDREKCLECGMNEHIAKPLDVERLFEVLRMIAG